MANVAGAPMARHFWIESNRDIESRSFAGLYLKVSQLCLLYHLITVIAHFIESRSFAGLYLKVSQLCLLYHLITVIAHLCEGCKKLLYLYKENNFTLHACFFVINKLRVKIYIHMHQLERYWPGGSVHMACQHGSAPNWVQWGGGTTFTTSAAALEPGHY